MLNGVVVVVVVVDSNNNVVAAVAVFAVVPISFPTSATISLSIGVVKVSPYRKGRSTYKTSAGILKVLRCSRVAQAESLLMKAA